jgi:hypothetical protein
MKSKNMNTYIKFVPNVFLAKCTEKHAKGEKINVSTKYGKENESIIYNFIGEKEGFYFYSIVRSDGFNVQEFARKKAEKYNNWAEISENKSNDFYKKSHSVIDNIPFGQPILIGHHSENRHRRDLDNSWNNMGKCVEFSNKAKEHENKSEYWKQKENIINLSMPESLEYYKYKLEKAKEYHEGLKTGKYNKEHSYSLTYAKKEVNEIEKKLKLANRLWGDNI